MIFNGIKSLFTILAFSLLFVFSNGSNKTASHDTGLRLITHNIWNGFSVVPEQKKLWIEWMRQQEPDVVLLQELNGYTPEKLNADAKSWGHPYSVLLKTEGFPTGITSLTPINDVQRILDGFHHGMLRVQIQGIYLYNIHLHPSNWKFRMQEIDLVWNDIKGLPPGAGIVLAGDFNALSRSDSLFYSNENLEQFFHQRDKEYNEKNLNYGKLDFTVISKIIDMGFLDTEFIFRSKNYHFTGTFPTSVEKSGDHGAFRRLDYVFVNNKLLDQVTNSKIIATEKTLLFSDHLPIITDIRL